MSPAASCQFLAASCTKTRSNSCRACVFPSGWKGTLWSEITARRVISSVSWPSSCRFSAELTNTFCELPNEMPRVRLPVFWMPLVANSSSRFSFRFLALRRLGSMPPKYTSVSYRAGLRRKCGLPSKTGSTRYVTSTESGSCNPAKRSVLPVAEYVNHSEESVGRMILSEAGSSVSVSMGEAAWLVRSHLVRTLETWAAASGRAAASENSIPGRSQTHLRAWLPER